MDKPVILIHFQPLELYPPVMNLIKFISRQKTGALKIITTACGNRDIPRFDSGSENIKIERFGEFRSGDSAIWRYYQYLKFYAFCLWKLYLTKPARLVYFETLSSLPAYLYWRYIDDKVKIYIHYHEYTSPVEYQTGMRLNRYFHRKEQKLYPSVEWLSHTNAERMRMFLKDEILPMNGKYHIMPNYPGADWLRTKADRPGKPRSIVYVGAVSRKTMYFEKFVDWVRSKSDDFCFDIYSNNISVEDREWLMKMSGTNVTLHGSVPYAALPDLLTSFDIGVVLYKGHIPNYVYNAPNKLFEYLACGLDVWLPEIMIGCKPYYRSDSFPKVIPVDFDRLGGFNWEAAIDRENLRYVPTDYFYESQYPEIVRSIWGATC